MTFESVLVWWILHVTVWFKDGSEFLERKEGTFVQSNSWRANPYFAIPIVPVTPYKQKSLMEALNTLLQLRKKEKSYHALEVIKISISRTMQRFHLLPAFHAAFVKIKLDRDGPNWTGKSGSLHWVESARQIPMFEPNLYSRSRSIQVKSRVSVQRPVWRSCVHYWPVMLH